MKTQIALVRHNEEVLENKRQHCKLPSGYSFLIRTLT